jgi:gliding motility-associated-like protein
VPGDETSSYQITVSDDCGHSVTDLVVVDAGCEVIIPNVFSPNNDGHNDEFIIAGIQGTENRVRIFNRWGQVVYEAQNYRNNWDAKISRRAPTTMRSPLRVSPCHRTRVTLPFLLQSRSAGSLRRNQQG